MREWDIVYVSDESLEHALINKDERIYLKSYNDWYECVNSLHEEAYKKWEGYNTITWKYIVPIRKRVVNFIY